MSQAAPSAQILAGVRVVELAQNAAVPHCGRLLAGLGADVVKVEPPEGDAMRLLAPISAGEGRGYAVINPGKRGMVIDLRQPEARPVVDALFAWADVALVAFKPADLARYGIDWDHAKQINPQLIHLTHTALGPEGPDAHHAGYDVLVQGRSGLGWLMNRSGGSAPKPTRPAVNDFSTGFVAAFAVLAALRHRDQTGEGQRVDTSLLGTAMSLATPIVAGFAGDADVLDEIDDDLAALRAAGAGFDDQRALYESRIDAASGVFRLYFRHYQTADGIISVAAMSPALFKKFHEITGLAPPAGPAGDGPGLDEVIEQAEALFVSKTTAQWHEALQAGGYPCGPYNLPHEALRDPQVRANDYVVELEHPTFGAYTTSGMPLRFEKAAATITGPSPRIGEHTVDVMADIGFDQQAVRKLLDAGTIVDGAIVDGAIADGSAAVAAEQ